MDILKLINNGYNPYFIKGFGGLSYHPDRNIQGGTVTTNLKKYSPSSQTFVIELEDPETGNVETVTNETDQQIAIPLLLAQLHNGERDKEDIEHVDKVVKLMADANIKRLSENELKVSEDIGRQIAELGKLVKKSKAKDNDLVGGKKALNYIDTTNEAVNKAIQAYKERKHIPTEEIILTTSKLIKEHGDTKRSLIKKVEGNIKRYNKNLVNGKPTSYNKEIIVDSSKKLISLYTKEMSMYSKLEQQTKIQQLINKYEGYVNKYSPQPKILKQGKKEVYIPETSKTSPSISPELLIELKQPIEAPHQIYKTYASQLNKYSANPLTFFETGDMSNIYPENVVGRLYDKENYEAGKDFEALAMADPKILSFLLNNMTTQLEDVGDVKKTIIVNTDEQWSSNNKPGSNFDNEGLYFMFDAMIKYYGSKEKFLDMLLIEFKKYEGKQYNAYNNLVELKENNNKDLIAFFFLVKREIITAFNRLRMGKIDEDELDEILDKYFTNSVLDMLKMYKQLHSKYNYVGIPVKFSKFNRLDDTTLDTSYPTNTEADAKYIKRISGKQQIKYLQTLTNSYLSGLERNSDDIATRAKYNNILKEQFIKPGEKGDLIIIVGIKNAVLVCNYSQKMREGYIDKTPFNSLQLAKTAYSGKTHDHYKIPLTWFETIPLK